MQWIIKIAYGGILIRQKIDQISESETSIMIFWLTESLKETNNCIIDRE